MPPSFSRPLFLFVFLFLPLVQMQHPLVSFQHLFPLQIFTACTVLFLPPIGYVEMKTIFPANRGYVVGSKS